MATVPRSVGLLAAAAAAVLLMSQAAAASDQITKLGSVAFELPGGWKVETDGTERLTASPSGTPDTHALVMAEFCDLATGRQCPAAEAPDAAKTGCADPQLNTKQWHRGIVEKRWTCPRTVSPAGAYTLAVGHFITPAWTLRVVYISTDKDKPPNTFFDHLAKTLRKD